jgi:NAD(P)-dependent dehydrogenase (short-subunit alcohol dehydrogenase family)
VYTDLGRPPQQKDVQQHERQEGLVGHWRRPWPGRRHRQRRVDGWSRGRRHRTEPREGQHGDREHDDLLAVKLDVTDPADAEAAVAAAVDRFGRIDVQVNNAGNFNAGFFEQLSPEEFRAQIETTFFGPVKSPARHSR